MTDQVVYVLIYLSSPLTLKYYQTYFSSYQLLTLISRFANVTLHLTKMLQYELVVTPLKSIINFAFALLVFSLIPFHNVLISPGRLNFWFCWLVCLSVGLLNPLTSRPGCIPGSRYTGVGALFFVI